MGGEWVGEVYNQWGGGGGGVPVMQVVVEGGGDLTIIQQRRGGFVGVFGVFFWGVLCVGFGLLCGAVGDGIDCDTIRTKVG